MQVRVIASERGYIDVQFEPKVETLRIPQPGSSVGLVHSNFGIIAYTVCVVGLNPQSAVPGKYATDGVIG